MRALLKIPVLYACLECIYNYFNISYSATYIVSATTYTCGRFYGVCDTCNAYKCVVCNSGTDAVISAGTVNIGHCGCQTGYYRNTNQCSACPTGCTACTDAATC